MPFLQFSRERGTGRRFQQRSPVGFHIHFLNCVVIGTSLSIPMLWWQPVEQSSGFPPAWAEAGTCLEAAYSCLALQAGKPVTCGRETCGLGSLWLVEDGPMELLRCTFPILKTWLGISLLLLHDFIGEVSWEKKQDFISAPLGHSGGDVLFLTAANVSKINSRRWVLVEKQRLSGSSITGQG